MTAPTDWKSLAEEAEMDDECPVEGCTNRARHRGRHNKRGLLPSTQAELDKETKKRRGVKPAGTFSNPNEGTTVTIGAPDWSAPVIVSPPEPVVVNLELVVKVRVIQ